MRHGVSFSVIKGLFRGFVRAPVQVPTSLPTITSSRAKAKIAADVCGDENLCRCLCRRTSRVIQAALVAHTLVCVGSTAIRLPIKTLPGSNYRTDIAITSVSSRLPRFGRIQTKSGPTTPPHVGSFRGHQDSPDLNSCQGGAGWILPPLAANPSLTSSQRDPSTTLSSDRAEEA